MSKTDCNKGFFLDIMEIKLKNLNYDSMKHAEELMLLIEYGRDPSKQIFLKTLIWDDDVLIIADDTLLKLDIDYRLNILKDKYLTAALEELHATEKQISIKIIASVPTRGESDQKVLVEEELCDS